VELGISMQLQRFAKNCHHSWIGAGFT